MSKTYDNEQLFNEIVGYYKDKAIVKDENGTIYYAEIPELLAVVGECMSYDDLTSCSTLPPEEYIDILNYLSEGA